MVPAIKKAIKEAQEALSKVDTKEMKRQVQQAVQFTKKKMQDLKKSTDNNELAIKVNNKDAEKQITQLEKEIDSLQKKITGRQLKLDITNETLDKIRNDTNQSVIKEMPDAGNKKIKQETYNKLNNDINYNSLVNQSDKLNKEIEKYNELLNTAKAKIAELEQQTSQTATTQNRLSSFFNAFKQKVEQVKPSISNIQKSFKGMPKITQNITNNIKGMGKNLKNGLGHVLKYAGALFSLKTIYSTLSSSASSWLSSQNAQAKQLSANIDYMKYAMGSVFAPVIEYVTNLIYNLMKAVQSLVYAFSGVNIFAKATANSMKSASGSASKASKSLAGIHNEINNVSDNSSSGGSGSTNPSIDLSQMDNTPNSIIDAIKNGNWYEVGATIGQKLNDAMSSIHWDKIQETAKNIGTGIAQTLNGFIATTDWKQVGKTIGNGINTAVDFTVAFIKTADWNQLGNSIGTTIGNTIVSINWKKIGILLGYEIPKALKQFANGIGEGIASGIFDGISNWFVEKQDGLGKIIWKGIFVYIKKFLGINSPSTVARDEIGIHISAGIIEGIEQGLSDLWNKIKSPFIEFGNNLLNKFNEIKGNIVEWSNNTKETVRNWGNNIKSKISESWSNASNTVKEKVANLKNNISTGLNNTKIIISNWGNNVRNTFTNLGKKASTWGKDLVSNMANGIKNNISKVTNAVNSVANKIKSFLHFTEPDEGPLSNFHTYMPDMIDLMVNGIRANTNKVKDEIENLAGTMSYTINTETIAGINPVNSNGETIKVKPQTTLNALEDVLSDFNVSNGQPLHVTIQYLGKEIFDDTIDYINSKTRRTGKNTIVTVGD